MERIYTERLKTTCAATLLCLGAVALSSCGEAQLERQDEISPKDASTDDISRQISDFIYELHYDEKPTRPPSDQPNN